MNISVRVAGVVDTLRFALVTQHAVHRVDLMRHVCVHANCICRTSRVVFEANSVVYERERLMHVESLFA